QNIYGVTPQQFSLIFGLNGVGLILLAQISGRLANYFDENNLLYFGILQSLFGSILLIFVVFFTWPLWTIMLALFLVVSSSGIVNTMSFSLGMNRQGERAGSASAFLGILPFAGGAVVSPLVGVLGEDNAIPLGVVILICGILA